MTRSRTISARVEEQDLCKAAVYLSSLGGRPRSLGTLVRNCINLVAHIADTQGPTWGGPDTHASLWLDQEFGRVGENRRKQEFMNNVAQDFLRLMTVNQQGKNHD